MTPTDVLNPLFSTETVNLSLMYLRMCISKLHAIMFIIKYVSTSKVGMEQVQNGRLYLRYRSSSMKNEAEESKSL